MYASLLIRGEAIPIARTQEVNMKMNRALARMKNINSLKYFDQ